MSEQKKDSIFKMVTRFISRDSFSSGAIRIVGIFLTLTGIMQGLDHLGVDIRTMIANKTAASVGLVLIIYLVIELFLSKKKTIQPNIKKTFINSLQLELENLSERKQFRKILRLREAMSRYLWVEGGLKERIILGEFTEEAALQLGEKETQAAALIDDLGWTLVSIKQYDRAHKCILHGEKLAIDGGFLYWQAKAHRHLAGMYTIKREFNKAYEQLDIAKQLTEQVTNEKKKLEMMAGIEYAIAITAFDEKDLGKAEEHAKKSDVLRREVGDVSRIIRCASLMGKIELEKGNIISANDYFRKGLEDATAIGRRDEMIRNHLGLASVYHQEHNAEKYSHHKSIADELKKDTPVPYEIDDNQKLTFDK